jgi:hypothetical protein
VPRAARILSTGELFLSPYISTGCDHCCEQFVKTFLRSGAFGIQLALHPSINFETLTRCKQL